MTQVKVTKNGKVAGNQTWAVKAKVNNLVYNIFTGCDNKRIANTIARNVTKLINSFPTETSNS